MLVDEITIRVRAGSGGTGAVAFNKNMMSLGPAGASGGRGGEVYAEGVADIGALRQFRFKKELEAENGENGKSQFNDGRDGKDLTLLVPVGTVMHEAGRETREVRKVGLRILIARGGRGGRGNFHFRSSTNTSPREYEEGEAGEEKTLRLELKLIAQVGLIGLPNAGKSSLLNELTAARSKVANYAFTTLEPNLGAYYGGMIIADIPGLIEGAAEGKGLGAKFLRHIERTRTLFHLVAADSETPEADYETVRRELIHHNPALAEKREYIILTKTDTVPEERVRDYTERLEKKNERVVTVSIHDDDALNRLRKVLNELRDSLDTEVE